MVTGYNVDCKHDGKTYHVQTEDRGRPNPTIETLIYLGGSIIHQTKQSYAALNTDELYKDFQIKKLLDQQHERLIALIKTGVFDPDRRPFGEEHLTNRTLDECVHDFLVEETRDQHLVVAIVGQSSFTSGGKGSVVVRALHDETHAPVPGVQINGRVILTTGGPDPVPAVETDASGQASVEFDVPADATVNALLVIQADSAIGQYELVKAIS